MTQEDSCNGDSLLSQASPEVTPVPSNISGPETPQNMVDRTLCMSNKKSDKRKREKENSKEEENSQG